MATMPDLPLTVQLDFNSAMIGAQIGAGCYRQVYEFLPDPSLVVKFEIADSKQFCNVSEWLIWQEIEFHPELHRWFAPCVSISPNGSVLLQKRTDPLARLPRKIPNLLADTKRDNWGKYRGRPVMHDYGNHAFYARAIKGLRMKDRL